MINNNILTLAIGRVNTFIIELLAKSFVDFIKIIIEIISIIKNNNFF